jgi:hypothetical protein
MTAPIGKKGMPNNRPLIKEALLAPVKLLWFFKAIPTYMPIPKVK